MMDEDEQAKYEAVIAQYGAMEASMGADGYAAFIKAQEAMRYAGMAHADRVMATAQMIRVSVVLLVAVTIPTLVWLWKWALSS